MEDPPGSPPSSGHTSLPPPPPPPAPPPPPPRRRRRTLFSFGSLPYQLVPRMPRPIPPHARFRPPKVMLQDDAPRASYSPERPKVLLLDDAPPASDSSERVGGFKMLSLDDAPTASDSSEWHDGNKDNEESFGEGDSDTCKYSSADDSDEDGECPFGNPYLRDSYGNLTNWRLSDLGEAFTKHLEDEAKNPKPKERKYTKEEKLKIHSDRMEGYMKVALHHYNNKEELVGDMKFEFEKAQSQNWIVEGKFDNLFYYHFNFEAKQAHSSVFTFFAEVTPEDGDDCDIICCKLLNDDDNGHCFGCKNEGVDDLRHPACESVYVGGHEDRKFPFMENSETEDDSD